ncbi:MAG: hypothetical protein ISS71_00415 [Phycisphaerae bacterium]|nr:hypothetical protein [Phycisphaerae bacterium]
MFSWHRNNALYRQRIQEIEKIRLRSEWLSSKDKALMQMIFEKGSTFEQIACLTGQNPSTISRRFHRLLQKLIAKELVSLLRRQCDIDDTDIRIVQDYFLQGLTQKAIAQKLNISLYRVRNILRAVRLIAYGSSTLQPCRVREPPEMQGRNKRNRKYNSYKKGDLCAHVKC